MSIRFACADDSRALLAVYAQYIETGITFEAPLPSVEEFQRRIESIQVCYPYLLWEEDGRILGYAYAHRYRERAAYDWDAELSIYLDRNAVSRGIGKKLYGALMELLRMQGVINVYGVVSTPNEKSEALHVGMGFIRQTTLKSMGYKQGRWLDVTYYEKQLKPHEPNPTPVVPIGEVAPELVTGILERFQQS